MKRIHVEELTPGMSLGRSIVDDTGTTLLNKNVELTVGYIRYLKERGYRMVYANDEVVEFAVPEADVLGQEARSQAEKAIKTTFHEITQSVEKYRGLAILSVVEKTSATKFTETFSNTDCFDQLMPAVMAIIESAMKADVLAGMYSLKQPDGFLFDHSIDVTVTSVMIGKLIGLERDKLIDLAMGCLVHDIGFVFLDESLIGYEDGLTMEKLEAYKQHTVLGYNLLRGDWGIMYPHVAYGHHEWQNGNGYPRGLKGSNSFQRDRSDYGPVGSLFGEICAVADYYDMLNSDTRIRAALSTDQALGIIHSEAGTRLNQAVVKTFFKLAPIYPIGSEVTVSGGPYDKFSGIVYDVNRDKLNRPTVMLIKDKNRKRISAIRYDIATENDDITIRTIWF